MFPRSYGPSPAGLAAVAAPAGGAFFFARTSGEQAPAATCEDVPYESGGRAVPAVLCRPIAARADLPGVVYLHGANGPEEVPARIRRQLAAEGFVVLAPAYFALTPAPG